MTPRVLLISPLMKPRHKSVRGYRLPQIALPIVAGLTPGRFEVSIVEEEFDDIDYEVDCDVVGISIMTANATRGYAIGREFRKRGKTVIFGGIHPSVMADEALEHGDAVVIGEAEDCWEDALRDWEDGRLRKKYRSALTGDLGAFPLPRRDLMSKHSPFNIKPVITSRGCPHECEFCSSTRVFGKTVRHLPAEKVVEDIVQSGGKRFYFVDENIIGDPDYSHDLFEALIPLRINWIGQATISISRRKELLKLAVKSGCQGMCFGLESVSEFQLRKLKKSIKSIEENEEAIRIIRGHGVYFHPSIVFGFDTDTEAVFDDTLQFLTRNKIASASFNILTPYPGTRIYKQFEEEGRLLTTDWDHYDHGTVVFKPKNISARKLAEERLRVRREFFGWRSVSRRISASLDHPFIMLSLNLAGRANTKRGLKELGPKMDAILNGRVRPAAAC
jgi:radical SAM superfamily enzyme YgiQ (UPF0313 family)